MKFFQARDSLRPIKTKSVLGKYRLPSTGQSLTSKKSIIIIPKQTNNAYNEDLPNKICNIFLYNNVIIFSNFYNTKQLKNNNESSRYDMKSRTNRSSSKEYVKYKKLDSRIRLMHKSLYDFRQKMNTSFKVIKNSKVTSI
jgi:hypothetical protein